MKEILGFRLFSRAARLGSISAAAKECGLSQSQASRIISELESSVGACLLSRTTRAVVPTDAGSEFLVRIEAILDAVEDARNIVREDGELRGRIRISMPSTVGYRLVMPRLSAFVELHPDLKLEVSLVDQRQDLVRDAVDIAIRMGKLADASATAQLLTSVPRVVLAAKSYIDRAGCPTRPVDLLEHHIIGGPAGAAAWTFEQDGKPFMMDLRPRFVVNDNEGAVAAALAGIGICSTPMCTYREELHDGSLVELLADWKKPTVDVHAYFPLGRSTRVAARRLVEFLKTTLSPSITPSGLER